MLELQIILRKTKPSHRGREHFWAVPSLIILWSVLSLIAHHVCADGCPVLPFFWMLPFRCYRSGWLPLSSELLAVVVAFQRKMMYLLDFLNCSRANVLKKTALLLLLLLPASSFCFCEQNYFPTCSSVLFFLYIFFCYCSFLWGRGFCCELISIIICYCRWNSSVLSVEYVIIFPLN